MRGEHLSVMLSHAHTTGIIPACAGSTAEMYSSQT